MMMMMMIGLKSILERKRKFKCEEMSVDIVFIPSFNESRFDLINVRPDSKMSISRPVKLISLFR